MNNTINFKGEFKFTLRDKYGNIKDERIVPNLITNTGFDFVADVMGNTTQPNDMAWTAIGTGVVAANVTDTTLGTEVAREANTYAHTPGTKVYTATVTFGAGTGTGAITESGLLNAATVGTLLNRQTFATINKGAADSLEVVWSLTLS